jgi:hypothetical protein
MPLTNNEKSLVEKLFTKLDIDKQGFIDARCGSSNARMLELVQGMQVRVKQAQEGHITLEDLMEYHEEYKQEKIAKGRDPNDEICKSFIEITIDRIDSF